MLHEYKRRQMEFEDREFCRYNLSPVKMSAPYKYYFDRQCGVGLATLIKADLSQPDGTLICGVGGGADLQFWIEHLPLDRCLALDFSIEAMELIATIRPGFSIFLSASRMIMNAAVRLDASIPVQVSDDVSATLPAANPPTR